MDIDTRTALGNTLNAFVSAPFSMALPLPFRVVLLGGIGIFSWATNVHLLYFLGIDIAFALDFRNPDRSSPLPSPAPHGPPRYNAFVHPGALYRPVYRIAGAYAAWAFSGWLLFRLATWDDVKAMDFFKFIPTMVLLGIAFALFMPFNAIQRRERRAFCYSLRRCVLLPVAQSVPFTDVLMADILTSFAKVIGDLWISAAMLLPSGSLEALPIFSGYWAWIVPAMMSLPYMIRLRQCMSDYIASSRQNRTQLWNAVKYATAFPVIFLSAMQIPAVGDSTQAKIPATVAEQASGWFRDNRLWSLWLLAVAVNSIYSFWWDVTKDWGLSLLSPSSANILLPPSPRIIARGLSPQPSQGNGTPLRSDSPSPLQNGFAAHLAERTDIVKATPYGLRPQLLFPDTVMYYLAILLNLVLRFTWSLKLSSHLHSIAELEHGVFIMEALELLRRWVWVFFRIEHEVVKRGGLLAPHRRGAPEMEDIQLRVRGQTETADDGP